MSRGCASPMGPSSLLFMALVLTLCTTVAGHGYILNPKARNWIAHLKGEEYCEHCLSAGGPGLVSTLTPGGSFPAKETVTTSVRHSMCGEAANIPASQRKYNPSPVPTFSSLPVYAAGQEFDISIEVSVHHRGHFEFRLCDTTKLEDPTTVTWACLDEHVLQRVSVPGEVSPVDVNHPERYYLEPTCAPNYNSTTKMRYKMPENLTCERCIMQWWWVTGNSCNPPGYAARSPQPAHVASGCDWWESDLTDCYGGWSYPEEFWNCADVRVVGAGNPAPALGNTEPPAKPAPKPAVATPSPVPAHAPVPAPAPQIPAAPVEQGCANLGWQCGGSGWTGSTCCNQGSCLAYIPEYSECRTGCPAGWLCNQQTQPANPPPAVPSVAPKAPPTAPPTVPKAPPAAPKAPPAVPKAPPAVPKAPPAAPKAPSTAPPTAPTPAATQTCAGNGWQCGGDGWTGSTCCVAGTQCYAYISTYSQCRSSCPVGWLCSADKQKDLLTSAIDWVKSLA